MKIEIYKSGYTQRYVVLINERYSDSFLSETEAIEYIKNLGF